MENVVVLSKTSKKYFCESEVIIKELDLKITCIFVPYRRKMKRKDKEKLVKLISQHDEVFTNDSDLLQFEHGVINKKWFSFFLSEGLKCISDTIDLNKISVESVVFSELLKRTVLELAEKYRIIELYTDETIKATEFARTVYDSVGLPILIKKINRNSKYETECVVKIEDDFSILNTKNGIEYTDLKLELLYPLCKHKELPVEKIIKAGLSKGKYKDILKKGLVKIVGEISK